MDTPHSTGPGSQEWSSESAHTTDLGPQEWSSGIADSTSLDPAAPANPQEWAEKRRQYGFVGETSQGSVSRCAQRTHFQHRTADAGL